MDEKKIYPYARSAAQVKADFAKGSASKGGGVLGAADTSALSQGLVGYWKMDESSANGCTGGANDSCDSSGNGKDGAWTNQATTSTTAKFGRSTTYDGTGDNITVSDTTTLGPNLITVSAWVNTDVPAT